MRIKAEHKDKVVTVNGTFVKISKKLGDMTRADLKQLELMGYDFTGLIEEPKKKATKKYKAIDETKEEDGE